MTQLQDLGEKRQIKYKTVLIDLFPTLRAFDEPVLLGSHSWILQNSNTRMILRDKVVNLFGFPQTGPEIARDYLRIYFVDKRRRAFREQVTSITAPRHQPLFADPCAMIAAAYVDLKSAYWSILKLTGWNVDYNPGKWLKPGYRPLDFPLPNDRVARNSLVTSGLSVPTRRWTGTKFHQFAAPNPFINYCLWAIVQDTLAAVALDALELGARYVHTDGYIVPMKNAEPLIERIRSYGLEGSIKYHGKATISAVGCYTIDGKRDGIRAEPIEHRDIREVDRSFLRSRLSVLTHR